MAIKKAKIPRPENQNLTLMVNEPEDIVSQLNVAVSGRHGLLGGPNIFSGAAAGRNDTLPCTKAAHAEGFQQIIVQVVESPAA